MTSHPLAEWVASAVVATGILFIAGCEDQPMEIVVEPTIESLFAVNGNGFVTLGWTGLEKGTPDEIDIHRSSQADFIASASTFLATVSGTTTRFDDIQWTNGQSYYYRLVPIEVVDGQRYSGTPTNVAVGRPTDYGQVTTISYDTHIQQIFTSSCAVPSCHVGPVVPVGSGLPRITHDPQFSLKSWEDLFYGEKEKSIAVPFRSSKSDIIFHTNNDTTLAPVALPHMPLAGFNLPVEQIGVVMRWIDEGARNESGEVPFPVSPAGRIISVCASEDLLAVTDVATNFLARYVPVGREANPVLPFGSPHHVKIDPQGEFFYVTLINAQQLWKFNATTYELVGTVSIPFQPADVALTSTGDSAYVTSFNSTVGLVTLVSTTTMQVLSSIHVPFASNPHGIVLSHDGSRAFVTNAGSGNITMITTADNSSGLIALDTLGNPFGSDAGPYLVDITPDDRYLFVTDFAPDGENVYVIDLVNDPTKPSRVIPIGGRSVHVAITPDGSKAFVCNFTQNSVNVISIPDFAVTTIADVGKQPHGVTFTPDGNTAYVTTENTLSPDPPHHPTSGSSGVSFIYVIDVPSLRIVNSIEVGAFGQGLVFVP
jgi:DNA-binding beta-propeller fold protein YncE